MIKKILRGVEENATTQYNFFLPFGTEVKNWQAREKGA